MDWLNRVGMLLEFLSFWFEGDLWSGTMPGLLGDFQSAVIGTAVLAILTLVAVWVNSRRSRGERRLDLPTMVLLLVGLLAFWYWVLLRAD